MSHRKPAAERVRDCMLGVSFPSGRVDELKRAVVANGLTVSAYVRMTILNKLDELKKTANA